VFWPPLANLGMSGEHGLGIPWGPRALRNPASGRGSVGDGTRRAGRELLGSRPMLSWWRVTF